MSYKIDLHGKSHQEAVKIVEKELILNSIYKFDTVEIITGKSPKLQELLIKEVIDRYDFYYYIPPNNSGMLIVHEHYMFI